MRPCRFSCLVLAALLGGCVQQEVKILDELPDPVIGGGRSHLPASRPPRQAEPPDFEEAGWVPARGISSRWTAIVIHHSASETDGAGSMDQYHRMARGWDELGYHFVIGNGSKSGDGQIEVGPRWTKQKHGAHVKTPDNYYNEHGIGICLVGDFEKHPPSPAQMRSLARLVRFLAARTGIPPQDIHAHGALKATACPGRYFPLDAFRRQLASPSWATVR